MSFFKRIFNFDDSLLVRNERRLARRFTISNDAPMKARLEVSGMDYPANLIDLSSDGAGLSIDTSLPMHDGLACRICLQAEDMRLPLQAWIAHVEIKEHYTSVGLDLKDNSYARRHSLVQILEPIAMASQLKPAPGRDHKQSKPGVVTTRYVSSGSSALSVFRNRSDASITGFEIEMEGYQIRSGVRPPALIFSRAPDMSAPKADDNNLVPEEESQELHRLFDWISLHLSNRVPRQVGEYLKQYRSA
ncbi:MAG: hypothetical protein SynsKO_09940 [Synoicihabitans sp.]